MNTLLLIFSGIVFTGLVITIKLAFGIQKSISDSYYKFNKYGKVAFILSIWAFTIPLMIVADSFLFLIAGGLLCLVGQTPDFKYGGKEYRTHMLGAYGGIVLGFTSLWIDFNLYPITITFIALALFLYYLKDVLKYIWWIEIAAYYMLLIGLIIKL